MSKRPHFLVVVVILAAAFFAKNDANAFGECSEYGIMVRYDSLTDECECSYGYIFGKDALGKTACISADSACHEKYGYNSRYDSLSDTCECTYGYVLGKDSIGRTQCVSESTLCTDQLGFNARFNALSKKCECNYGYIIENGRCSDGDTVCRSDHGIYSSYSELSNKCECDSGYTVDESSQCVKKQNSAYFTLKEVDTSNEEAIIESDYVYQVYRISYGMGCMASSIERYVNKSR